MSRVAIVCLSLFLVSSTAVAQVNTTQQADEFKPSTKPMLTRLLCSAPQQMLLAIFVCSLIGYPTACFAQNSGDDVELNDKTQHPSIRVLDEELRTRLNAAVDRSLQWMADQQLARWLIPNA